MTAELPIRSAKFANTYRCERCNASGYILQERGKPVHISFALAGKEL